MAVAGFAGDSPLGGPARHDTPQGGQAPDGEPFAATVETLTGVVQLVGDRAYKMKKPVSFGFADFSTLESRREACRRELELNRRLAPDVYLGTASLVAAGGDVLEHVVVMRRLPAARRLALLARLGEPLGAEIRALARILATFHAGAARGAAADRAAGAAATLERWEVNHRRLEPAASRLGLAADAAGVLELARRYVAGRTPLFAARIRAGRACDGHGDLLADDVFCLPGGPRVLDCLDFDEALRLGDGLADVAFLAMDLERLGRADLARLLLAQYAAFAGDRWPSSLEHHQVAYRAQVRALVVALRAVDRSVAADERDALAGQASSLLALARRHLDAARVRCVVVGGLPGSGKSTVAGGLAEELGAVVLRSDEVRKQLLGVDVRAPAPSAFAAGAYRPEITEATYRALVERARALLGGGESVVLDATFHDPAARREVGRLAEETASDLVALHCTLPRQEREARLAARSGDVSDAGVEVARALEASEVPWPEARELRTDAPPAQVLDRARRSVVGADEVGTRGAAAPAGGDLRP